MVEPPSSIPHALKPALPQITVRALAAGLFIGSIVLVSNFQFGLQSGWVSMMSLPSSLLGFAIFKSTLSGLDAPFTDVENVFVQSVAVAVGTGPLAYGFVGIIPAMEKLMTAEESGVGHTIRFSLVQLFLWSIGIGFFGVFFSIPLRKQMILKERLPFPSGSATATLISVLHRTEILDETTPVTAEPSPDEEETLHLIDSPAILELSQTETYHKHMASLRTTFTVSACYTMAAYFAPVLREIPVLGSHLSQKYLWNFQPSPAYIGQGIIMGLPTTSYMLFGAIAGWGFLAPLAHHFGWAPGAIDDWQDGGQGWILWLSLAAMMADSVTSFVVVTLKSLYRLWDASMSLRMGEEEGFNGLGLSRDRVLDRPETAVGTPLEPSLGLSPEELLLRSSERPVGSLALAFKSPPSLPEVGDAYLVSNPTTYAGLVLSSLLCVICIRWVFGPVIPVYSIVAALLMAFFLSVLGVRALGETDLNPVSGIGKISQLLFAFIIPKDHPGTVLINLVAGGIAEAGAQQAGDLMQDLKTGHLVGASPKAQFVAQMVGSLWLVVLSGIIYRVYDSVYEIPGKVFRIPTAVIWIDCSRLVTGQGLPPHALTASIIVGLLFSVILLAKNLTPKTHWLSDRLVYLPSGVAVGVGMYNTPSFTLARFAGGLGAWWWMRKSPKGGSRVDRIAVIVFSSGLVLGEGMLSCVTMAMTSVGVPHF